MANILLRIAHILLAQPGKYFRYTAMLQFGRGFLKAELSFVDHIDVFDFSVIKVMLHIPQYHMHFPVILTSQEKG